MIKESDKIIKKSENLSVTGSHKMINKEKSISINSSFDK
jgi:hypothetical protein